MNINNLFQNFPQFEAGQVWLAGAGPGRLGMVTLECVHAIQTCDMIIYDALVNSEILEWARARDRFNFRRQTRRRMLDPSRGHYPTHD